MAKRSEGFLNDTIRVSSFRQQRPVRHAVDEARLLPRFRQPGTNTPSTSYARGSTDTHHSTARAGTTHTATPAELRGIPVQARGVGGTIPHTQPMAEAIYRLTPRERYQ